jgi:hypothetical protein
MIVEGDASLTTLLPLAGAEVAFKIIFVLVLIVSVRQALHSRLAGLPVLIAITYWMERSIVEVCLVNERPHWAATAASLLWAQLLSASELLLSSRIDASQLPENGRLAFAAGLLWNMRRIGTSWQVKNVPSVVHQQAQTRASFIFWRLALLLIAYVFVDVMVSMPAPDPAFVQAEKATLFSLGTLGVDDVAFRTAITISYWITTATLNLFMVNIGAVAVVLLRLNGPADCPLLYGSFWDACTVRHFWG